MINKYYCGVGSKCWWHVLLHGEIEVGHVHGTLGMVRNRLSHSVTQLQLLQDLPRRRPFRSYRLSHSLTSVVVVDLR